MSHIPQNLHYTETHEWLMIEEDIVTVGITDHAQSELGDLVFVQLPALGDQVEVGDDMVVVESVKAASDVIAPLAGEIVAVNDELNGSPELINEAPYEAWIVKIKITSSSDLSDLLSPQQYEAYTQ